MKNMEDRNEKKIKITIIFLIGIILGVTIPVAAQLVTSAENITLSSSKTEKENVKEAIEDLYEKAGKCPNGWTCKPSNKLYTLTKSEWNNGSNAEIGDTIGITVNGKTENFYVISNDNHKVSALAYYNLNVGVEQYRKNGVVVNAGIQDKHALGMKEGLGVYGSVTFTSLSHNSSEGENNLEKIYEGEVNTALYNETTGYEKYIQRTIPEAKIRLIYKSELDELGCNMENEYLGKCNTETMINNHREWIYSISYWSGTAANPLWGGIWGVGSNGELLPDGASRIYFYGVRPVVEFTES